jgi:dihydrofolate reductase
MIIGSASVVQALTRRQLIDEFRFFLFPVVLGAGKPLFPRHSSKIPLKTRYVKHFDTGVVRLDYARP